MSLSRNRILASLSTLNQLHLLSLSEKIDLPLNLMLSEEAVVPQFAYLLESGFASQVIRSGTSGEAEVGMVGRDGVTGFWSLLGPAKTSSRTFMQAAGAGYRIPITRLRQCFLDSEAIRLRILEYVQEQTVMVAYLMACNKLHDTEPRLARWLLMVADHLETDTFPFTHEFLAQMLGVRRMTVTLTAGALQRGGFIEYKRGTVRILDRPGLTDAACECYRRMKRLDDNLYLTEYVDSDERTAGE